jgi:hypothetical protein
MDTAPAVGDAAATRPVRQESGLAQLRPSQLVTAVVIGAGAGAALGAERNGRTAAQAALAGGAVVGASEALARRRQRPDEIPALWHRILVSAALAAPAGWLVDRVGQPPPRLVGLAAGGLAGLMGVRPQKVAYGPAVGWAIGRLLDRPSTRLPAAAVAAVTVAAYRISAAVPGAF